MPDRDQTLSAVKVHSAETVDTAWWDSLVLSSPDATVFQSGAWAAYLRALGHQPRFLWSTDVAGHPRGLVLVQRAWSGRRSLIARLLGRAAQAWTWRHGPLALGTGPEDDAVHELADAAEAQARRRGTHIERVTPPLHHGRAVVESVLTGRGWTPIRQATIVMDLRPSEEALWRALKPTARKALGRCERDGVKVRRLLPDEPLDDYLEVLQQTRQRLGFGLPPHYPSATMRRAFQGTAAVAEVFVAERGARVLGGLGVIGFGPAVIEIAAAQSSEALAEKLYTSDAIKWAVIRWAREAGFRWYDLGGIDPDPNPTAPKAAAIRQFKEKWGGAVVEFAAFSEKP